MSTSTNSNVDVQMESLKLSFVCYVCFGHATFFKTNIVQMNLARDEKGWVLLLGVWEGYC